MALCDIGLGNFMGGLFGAFLVRRQYIHV